MGEMVILGDELEQRGIPSDGLGMTMLVANTILQAGSEEMKRTVLPGALAGELMHLSRLYGITWRFGCGCGKDLCRARR